MIRFVYIGNQIDLDDDEPAHRFAFWDTRTDEFLSIGGSQAFKSVDDLKFYAEGAHGDYIKRLIEMAEIGLSEALDNLAQRRA